ncbi:uncharacterized protein LOC111714046 [Eurytemora carolleeae]|uniref:uncharacterized protein LOC111714046 n=1 Tax=Eurytemora carolleeae TaxID=1294199 RepID=UPI000C7896B4|nr:uncharacterized protein LOC111714046 [Eurytemora carolleeae]|eukprot:XP_023344821.1 uncharacterized protein LOC111714046 [Eurytemora affinis]
MLRYSGSILTRILAIIVTCWFISHSVYLVDESYRTVLRLTWKAKYGDIDYKQVLTPEKMILLHTQPKSEYLGSLLNITGNKLWKEIETDLENSLLDMFQRTDKMKGWEIKKIGSDAWQSVSKKLKVLDKELESHSPYVNSKNQDEPDMKNILIYNRLSKSGSTWLMSLIYQLREQLGYLGKLIKKNQILDFFRFFMSGSKLLMSVRKKSSK